MQLHENLCTGIARSQIFLIQPGNLLKPFDLRYKLYALWMSSLNPPLCLRMLALQPILSLKMLPLQPTPAPGPEEFMLEFAQPGATPPMEGIGRQGTNSKVTIRRGRRGSPGSQSTFPNFTACN